MSRGKGARNRSIGAYTETPCSTIQLARSEENLVKVLAWGAIPIDAPYTHQEIAHWCSAFSLDESLHDVPALARALDVAEDVDAQWDLFLANTYLLAELQQLDYASVRLPDEWFREWLAKLGAA